MPTAQSQWSRLKRTLAMTAVATVVVAVLVTAFLWWAKPLVTVTHTSTGPVVQAFYATGTVRPVREFPIRASTAGTLEKVLVDKGDRVKAGQPLAVINDPALTYAVSKAEADLDEKKKRLDAAASPVLVEFDERLRINTDRREIAQRDYDRFESMSRTNAVSKADRDQSLDRAKMIEMERESLVKQRAAKLLELQRELASSQAAFDTAVWLRDEQTLKSPIDGVVLDRPTSQGTRAALNDVTMRIADIRPENLVMRAQVDEEDVTHCRVGETVRMSLYAFAGQPITGRVKQIYDEADPDRRTFEVDVAFDASLERLAAGMTGELAFIESEKASATVLPATAVQGGRVCVVREGKLVETDASIGLRSVERVEVLGGIESGDQVVVSPLGTLTAGTRVRVNAVDPEHVVPKSVAQQANSGAASIKKGF